MPEQSRSDSLWQIGTTALLTAAAIGGVQFWVQGDQHVTGNISGSGSISISTHLNATSSPFCINVDGKAKRCLIRAALTSTGGTVAVGNSFLVFNAQNTSSVMGSTGTASVLNLTIGATAPGEALSIACGTTTGSSVLESTRTNLFHFTALNSGGTIGQVVRRLSGSNVVLHADQRVVCTQATVHERDAGLTGEATLEIEYVN